MQSSLIFSCRTLGKDKTFSFSLSQSCTSAHMHDSEKLKVLCLSKVRQRQISEICMTMCLLNDLAITYLLVTRDKFARLDL